MKTWQWSLLCVLVCVVGLNSVVYAWPWPSITLSVDGRDQPLSLSSSDVKLPTYENTAAANPSIVSAPDGHLYAAYQRKHRGGSTNTGITISRSIDGGETWEILSSSAPLAESGITYGTPSITYLETDTQKMIFVVYAAMNPSDGSASIELHRITIGSIIENRSFTIVDNLYLNSATDQIYPEICTDYPLETSNPSLYVTYSSFNGSDIYPVEVCRSQNLGQTWDELQIFSQMNEAGIDHSKRPDIEYGAAGLFLVYLQVTSSGNKVRLYKSTDKGDTWEAPPRFFHALSGAYTPFSSPRVSVALDNLSVLMAYVTRPSPGIHNIDYAYSTDGGSNWMMPLQLVATGDDQPSVELGRSKTGETFYAAYWQRDDIYYISAKTTSPRNWTSSRVISDGHTVSRLYSKPGIDFDPKKPEEGICAVWTDDRLGDLKTFFNSTSRRELFALLNVPFAQIGGSETMSYTMTVENIFEDLNTLTVINQLSDLVTYTSGTVALNGVVQEPLAVTDGLWTYSTADLAYGDVLTFSFDVVVDAGIDPGDLISNLINVQYVYGLSNTLLEYSREVAVIVGNVPEPATWALIGLGLLGGGLLLRRKRRA